MPTLVVELTGPDFVKNAAIIAQKLKIGSVSELRVQLGRLSPESPNVKAAVVSLKKFLMPNAAVYFVTSAGAPPAPAGGPAGSGSQPMFLVNSAEAQQILTQIQTNSQQQQIERWQQHQELQTKIFNTIQDVTTNRAKTQDKAFNNMDAYIRG